MRPLALTLALAAAGTAGFFDDGRVNFIELRFAEPDWDEILDSLYARGLEERLAGTAIVNGVRFDSVGVRYKGHSSYNPSRRKNPLNIKLDYRFPDQEIEGHGTLRLANVYKDPSFVRETVSYEIARRYMAAGRANYAGVTINDMPVGLYTNIEDVDKRFLRERFGSDGGAKFKGQMDDSAPGAGWKYYGADSAAYRRYYELESDSGWRELVGFLDTIVNHRAAAEEVLDVDRHLWMLAFDIVMVNLDAPINMPQNYYLYRHDGRFSPAVWDLNENFGAFRDVIGVGQLTVAQMQQFDPFFRAADPDYPIAGSFFTVPRRRKAYVAHARTMIAECFASGWYEDRAFELQDAIDAHVRADPNKFYSYNDFTNNVNRSVGSGPLAIVGLTELMNVRVAYLATRPEFQAEPPALADPDASPARPQPGNDVRITVRAANADSVFLGWRQTLAGRFHRVAMRDDSATGTWTAMVRAGAGDLDYCFHAENAAAAAFLPARAEHEFFTLPVAGSVVINELMALNETTVRDPAGEYEDWVELYNNSTVPVALRGWYLSDDTANPTKWTFPNVTIPAGRFLAVWCDDDVGQPGLHANFQLAAGGEAVVLTNSDLDLADRVVFGQQTADISHGRWPNGTGSFRRMNPTFLAANDSGVGIAADVAVAARLEATAQPNPFPGRTSIRWELTAPAVVTLRVFDAAGRLVATPCDGPMAAGRHERSFAPGPGAPGGVYFAQLQARDDAGDCLTGAIKLVRTR
ncbi:MAG: CotH kinase family protein [bacterium]